MITIILLHPLKSIPVQKWTFDSTTPIKIGRSNDNNVVLYSAVVSRHHVELQPKGNYWDLINTGSNGTFVDGKKIKKVIVKDGMIIRLASSGPKIQIKLNQGREMERDSHKTTQNSESEQVLTKDKISKETLIN